MDIKELIERWDSDEGKPYKGSLIDWDAYQQSPNAGCMCAQGQALHFLGGWTPERLCSAPQREADLETARLLNISIAHAVLLRNVNDTADGAPSVVLTDPAKVLGDQASKVLDFWWAMDQMTGDQWDAARTAAWAAVRDAAGTAAGAAARDAARTAAWAAVRDAARDAAVATAWASNEIQGARILRERNHPFFFLPLFGFADPEAIPPRPDNYGPMGMVQ